MSKRNIPTRLPQSTSFTVLLALPKVAYAANVFRSKSVAMPTHVGKAKNEVCARSMQHLQCRYSLVLQAWTKFNRGNLQVGYKLAAKAHIHSLGQRMTYVPSPAANITLKP